MLGTYDAWYSRCLVLANLWARESLVLAKLWAREALGSRSFGLGRAAPPKAYPADRPGMGKPKA